jgi:hypothetical protein
VAAAAVVAVDDNGDQRAVRIICPASEYDSAYSVELVGLLAAQLATMCDTQDTVINSDCASALKAMVPTEHVKSGGSHYLKLLANKLSSLRHNVQFVKVKAHPERVKGLRKVNWDSKQKGIYAADLVAGNEIAKFNRERGTLLNTIHDNYIRRWSACAASYFVSVSGELPIVSDIKTYEGKALDQMYRDERNLKSQSNWDIITNKLAAGAFAKAKGSAWYRAVRLIWGLHITGSRALRFHIALQSYLCPMCNRVNDDFDHIFNHCTDAGINEIRQLYNKQLSDFYRTAISMDTYKGSSLWHIRNVRDKFMTDRAKWWLGMFDQQMIDALCYRQSSNPREDYRVIRDSLKITVKGIVAMFKYYKICTDKSQRWRRSTRDLRSAEVLESWLIRSSSQTAKDVSIALRDASSDSESEVTDTITNMQITDSFGRTGNSSLISATLTSVDTLVTNGPSVMGQNIFGTFREAMSDAAAAVVDAINGEREAGAIPASLRAETETEHSSGEILGQVQLRELKRCSNEGCHRYIANVYLTSFHMPDDLIYGDYCYDDVDDMLCVTCMRNDFDERQPEADQFSVVYEGRTGIG